MRIFISACATTVTSIAFQISLAIWPDALKRYAWAVKYVWVLAFVFWFVWVVVFFAQRIKGPKTNSAVPAASGGITVNINPNISPTISSAINQTARESAVAVPNPPEPVRRPKPNLVFTAIRFARVRFFRGEYGSPGALGETTDLDHWSALDQWSAVVVCVRNEPIEGTRVAHAGNVRAQIVYRNAEGKEVGVNIGRGCWLDDEYEIANIPVGDSKELVLIVVSGDKRVMAFSKVRNRTAPYTDTVTTNRTVFEDLPSTIEVRLIGDRSGEYVAAPVTFDFELVDGQVDVHVREPQG